MLIRMNKYKNIFRDEIFHFSDLSIENIKRNDTILTKNKKWFSYGRQALDCALDTLKIENGNYVLLPSFICNELIPLFLMRGVKYRFYKITKNFNPDFDDIQNNFKSDTKAILLINYFGFPRKNKELRQFCDSNDIFLIEDNTQGILSSLNGSELGSYGDVSFASLRKCLPVINGAFLQINNQDLCYNSTETKKICSVNDLKVFKYYLRKIYYQILFKDKIDKRALKNLQSGFLNENFKNPDLLLNEKFTKFSMVIIKLINFKKVIKRKKRKV